ncbi:hypothetical protein [Nocardiopsis alkaliphila]|uniref:hypothetical protein n=1 Tax=Nocardiopsis alkaliphila TaxID=225762 RepID=UPI000349C400|nr:hypothetical protein [Nocardiopsis alkaliphila]
MTSTPEDNTGPQNTDQPPPEEGGRPTFEPAGAETESTEEIRPEHQGASPVEGTEPGQEAPAEPRPGGAFSAETFALVGLVLLAVTIMSGQLIEMLTSMILVSGQPIAPEQIGQIEIQLMIGGAMALLTVIFAGLSLTLTNPGTRPWAKWSATAALIVALLLVLAAAVAYYLIPEAAEQMIPPIFD